MMATKRIRRNRILLNPMEGNKKFAEISQKLEELQCRCIADKEWNLVYTPAMAIAFMNLRHVIVAEQKRVLG